MLESFLKLQHIFEKIVQLILIFVQKTDKYANFSPDTCTSFVINKLCFKQSSDKKYSIHTIQHKKTPFLLTIAEKECDSFNRNNFYQLFSGRNLRTVTAVCHISLSRN